jgi:hypothetical protein
MLHRAPASPAAAELSLTPRSARAEASYEAGMRMIRFGALWTLGGTLVTALSFAVADGTIGHVFAWAAIAFGLADVVRGMTLCARAREHG